jgi:hypothetical protein
MARAAFDAFSASITAGVSSSATADLEQAQALLRMSEAALASGTISASEHEQCIHGVLQNCFLHRGTRVVITGLAARPELNGCVARVVGDLKDGRVPVEVPSEAKHVRLRPANMRPAPPSPLATEVEPGSLVEVSGLASASASIYNACIGEVLSVAESDERVAVRVHAAGETKCLRVKPANLRAVDLESCLADGAACLDAGRPRDALARAQRAVELAPASHVANVLCLRAVQSAGRNEPRTCQVMALADAALEAVERCGLAVVPPDVCVSTSGLGGAHPTGVLAASADDPGWPRERSSAYTVGLSALLLASQVRAARGGETAMRIALLGCRWHIEGRMDWRLLRRLVCRYGLGGGGGGGGGGGDGGGGDGACPLVVTLVGPEMSDDEGAEERRAMARAADASEGGIHVRVLAGAYHDVAHGSDDLPPHLAVVLCGGVDNEFGSWGRTLSALLRDGVPCAFTGYGLADGSTTHDAGLEPLLRLMRAQVVCAPHPNPFRFVMFGRASDAFVLAVCGCGTAEPPTDAELPQIHRSERAARLDGLAQLNERDGQPEVARRLRELRAQLLAGEVHIPPAVTHGDLEGWAMGTKQKAW